MIQDKLNRIRERTVTKNGWIVYPKIHVQKWERTQQSVRTILSTEKETILKAWKKKFKADFDFDRELENQDVEEEFLLQIRMDDLMINYEDEATEEDSEISKGQCKCFLRSLQRKKKQNKVKSLIL